MHAFLFLGIIASIVFQYTTAIFKAVKGGHVEVVKILLDRGADIEAFNSVSRIVLLFCSVDEEEIIRVNGFWEMFVNFVYYK